MIITEGIIIDFIRIGIISFPSETKIKYYLNNIEKRKNEINNK